jgi:8-oxo-dGTP diphosphatase
MSGKETKIATDAEMDKIIKAKVAIVALIDRVPSILVLTRSELEDTRAGEGDWPGGKADPGEEPEKALDREVGEELPGVRLRGVRKLTVRHKINEDGVPVESHLFAAQAELPSGGIKLSDEHDDYDWVPFDEFPNVDIPKKYRRAVASESGRLVLDELAQLTQPEFRKGSHYSTLP